MDGIGARKQQKISLGKLQTPVHSGSLQTHCKGALKQGLLRFFRHRRNIIILTGGWDAPKVKCGYTCCACFMSKYRASGYSLAVLANPFSFVFSFSHKPSSHPLQQAVLDKMGKKISHGALLCSIVGFVIYPVRISAAYTVQFQEPLQY